MSSIQIIYWMVPLATNLNAATETLTGIYQIYVKDFKTSKPIMDRYHSRENWLYDRNNSVQYLNKMTKVWLTYKKIWYCQIQEVVITLSPQTLVHFKSQNNQCVTQNYHNNQSHHHHHQNNKYGSWKHEAALDSSWGIAKIVSTGVWISFFLRHDPDIWADERRCS